MLDSTVTVVTDKPMEIAFFLVLDVPRKGHSPRNLVRTTFSTRNALRNMLINFIVTTSV